MRAMKKRNDEGNDGRVYREIEAWYRYIDMNFDSSLMYFLSAVKGRPRALHSERK